MRATHKSKRDTSHKKRSFCEPRATGNDSFVLQFDHHYLYCFFFFRCKFGQMQMFKYARNIIPVLDACLQWLSSLCARALIILNFIIIISPPRCCCHRCRRCCYFSKHLYDTLIVAIPNVFTFHPLGVNYIPNNLNQ